jgi:hypothetical protein
MVEVREKPWHKPRVASTAASKAEKSSFYELTLIYTYKKLFEAFF